MTDAAVYAGLFMVALAAATVLPLQSETALVGLLLADAQPAWLLLVVASLGNVLGSTINWLLGRSIERFRDKPWFPVKAAALTRAQERYRRYGRWSLLLSWAPIIGDPITVAAGIMRERFIVFLALVAFAKVARYLALAAATLHWT